MPMGRVDLAEVEETTLRVCREYGVTRLRFDRMQAEGLTQNLARAGVHVSEFLFISSEANHLARTLYMSLRNRALELPDDPEVREQFLTARMVETGPSTVKLANPPGTHDDIPTAVGMVAVDLAEHPGAPASTTAPRGRIKRPLASDSPHYARSLPSRCRESTASRGALLDARRGQPRG